MTLELLRRATGCQQKSREISAKIAIPFMYPRCSMCGIFTYIWLIFGVNVGKYSIHGASGYGI
jgi:hypothetical protein